MAIGTTIKTIQDIMRKDAGVDGDAQRISQLVWMIFLKVFDDHESQKEALEDYYRSPVPARLRWRSWAKDSEGITGEQLLDFVNNDLFKTLKELPSTGKNAAISGVVRGVFEDAFNYILVTITGANVGKAARVTQSLPEAYVSQHVALIRLRDPRHAPWVHTWLVSPRNGRATLTATSYGDKPGLNLDNVKSVPIRIPSLVMQQSIIAKVEHLMKLCDDLEAKLRRAEDRASKLVEAVVQEMLA